jgi:hypothetical protein
MFKDGHQPTLFKKSLQRLLTDQYFQNNFHNVRLQNNASTLIEYGSHFREQVSFTSLSEVSQQAHNKLSLSWSSTMPAIV